MKKVLLTILGASTLLVALCMVGCGTAPVGFQGKITVSATTVTGSNAPLTVTLLDPDIADTSVTVKVTSGAYPKGINLMLTGKKGTFTGPLYFSTTVADIDTIRVIDGDLVTITYADAFPAGSRTAQITWSGAKGKIALDAATYTSIAKPMTITVTDLDMSAPTLDVDIMTTTYNSQKTTVVLKPVAGSYGVYSGKVYFTPGLTAGNDTIRVKDGDVVTVTYNDEVPPGTIATATATWHGIAGVLALDSTAYNGMTSKATITLIDSDLVVDTVNVKVTSMKDSTGIILALVGSAGTYSGKLGFTIGSSAAGKAIAVQDSDVVKVSYTDAEPAGIITKTANWYSTLIPALGIFGSSATPGATVVPGLLTNLFTWSGTCTVDSAPNFSGTGNAVRITAGAVGWAGFGWAQVDAGGALASLNMTTYVACSLHVRLKGNASGIKILVENLTHTGQTFLATSTYGYVNDEQWHEIVIPLSAWSATCDLSNVDYFMGATFDPFVAGQYIIVDDLYWTLPQ
ncbi:MAG TPA: hypothetical protein VKF42_11895 [Chitinivibrionales bacterium]|jgi:hypothetical protein|nr:hypothetical protein [Chitinivibrionales bacterium]